MHRPLPRTAGQGVIQSVNGRGVSLVFNFTPCHLEVECSPLLSITVTLRSSLTDEPQLGEYH